VEAIIIQYNNIEDEGLEDEIVEVEQEELFGALSITDFTRPALTTLITMCDASISVIFSKGKAK
jgi:hypothetical protein